jgi:hypothetical protein
MLSRVVFWAFVGFCLKIGLCQAYNPANHMKDPRTRFLEKLDSNLGSDQKRFFQKPEDDPTREEKFRQECERKRRNEEMDRNMKKMRQTDYSSEPLITFKVN